MDQEKALARRIKRAREAYRPKMSQEELGKRLGIEQSTVSLIENGVSEVGAIRLVKLAEILGRPVTWFLGIDTDLAEDDRGRHVYLGNVARRALWRYLAEREPEPTADDPLFVSLDRYPMDRSSISHMLRELGKRAGVAKVHPHRFRHTMALWFLRNGGDVFSLQRILGHATLDMVRQYVALAEADAASAHRKASPADNWRLG